MACRNDSLELTWHCAWMIHDACRVVVRVDVRKNDATAAYLHLAVKMHHGPDKAGDTGVPMLWVQIPLMARVKCIR